MRRFTAVVALASALVLGGAGVAHAATPPPPEFGTHWDDPRTAAPPIVKPPTHSCTEQIVDHGFADFNTFVSAHTPPADCAGPWTKVVLHLDGAVKGRQFDRLGWLTIGGAMVLKTSTPEPSPDGVQWSVEKDLTSYSALLRTPQTVNMFLGNVVNDTFTGVLFIKVSLTFYAADRRNAAPDTASDVLPLAAPTQSGADLTGTVTVPRNTERLLAEVYATGSGGACEEFWYFTAPTSSGYSCPADPGPYREVQVLLDGRVAGIAEPFPHVYTGGWSNPFLWYVLPAPRAFNVQPITYDLSPYLGLLTDGVAHQVSVHVVGVPPGQTGNLIGWDTPVNFLAWRDPHASQVTGGLLADRLGDLTDTSTVAVNGTTHTVTTHGAHELTAVGFLRTSHGIVTSLVHQQVRNDGTHTWGDGENPDGVTSTWTDDSLSLVVGFSRFAGLRRSAKRFAIDGTITVDAANRLTTVITMTDAAAGSFEDTYTGQASYTLGVPREQRHAMGTSRERYRADDFDHTISTVNGFVVDDRLTH